MENDNSERVLMKWGKKEELQSIESQIEWIQNEGVKKFVRNSFIWSISKAWKYLAFHVTLTALSIVLPAISPIVISFRHSLPCSWPIITTILSALTTICVALTVSLRVKDLWKEYRNSAEELKRECLACRMCIGKYEAFNGEGLDLQKEKERQFCENLLSIHSDFMKAWKKTYSNAEKAE